MCTMTLLPLAGPHGARLRIAFNRDESRKRAEALPPQVRACGARHAMMPIDPVSDGTWIAVNDAGLAAALLNLHRFDEFGREPHKGTRSRGEIIPMLMECATIDEALERILTRVHRNAYYSPFRLVLTDGRNCQEYKRHGGSDGVTPNWPVERPRMFTSSGLGDALVHMPRKRLFEEMFAAPADPIATQDAFHRHQWPDHPELSVCMSRREARTVSLTVLELNDRDVRMAYYPAPPDEPVKPFRVSLQTGAPA
jgi:hypothetical protein